MIRRILPKLTSIVRTSCPYKNPAVSQFIYTSMQHYSGITSDTTPIGRIKPSLSIVFTCNVCKTRQIKTMSKHSYEKGVVLIQCKGCEKIHLIADNLGWFRDEQVNIVSLLKEKQEEVRQLTDIDMLDVDDLKLFNNSTDNER